MDPRINIITLGVQEIARSRKFYEAIGFKAAPVSNDHITLFQLQGIVLCLYPEPLLAEDALQGQVKKGFRGITFAYSVANKSEVAEVLEEVKRAGATVVKPAQDVFWGGHSGYFADPDGHLWEVAWNPHWPLKPDGSLSLG